MLNEQYVKCDQESSMFEIAHNRIVLHDMSLLFEDLVRWRYRANIKDRNELCAVTMLEQSKVDD